MSARPLESYIAGRWWRAPGEGLVLRDASTGEGVATVVSEGLDTQALLQYARQVGGPALRRLTFTERAAALRGVGKRLMELKESFYEQSWATGATRADAWVDIEGGIGTLLTYASRGGRELPNARVLLDGEVERLSKQGTFVAQHVHLPFEGAAIHINAFNFPVWGFLEKLAPAILAGMPVIVKPATATSYLTEAVVRQIIAMDLLPTGALQLVVGSVGDLFTHLTCQDVVSFTGSAATAARLRTHPRVVSESVRFLAETDSLNCALLGPDAVPGTPEFDLFVREVVREMTAKAGQKCTAIRKVIVPDTVAEPVAAAIAARLATITVGDPRDADVRMGPLATLAQRTDVLAAVQVLRAEAEVVAGDVDIELGATGQRARGAFLSPVLLRSVDAVQARLVHTVEAFGPVATLLPYRELREAVTWARRGEGSLVSSVFTADDAVAEELVLGLAPYHGRLLVVNRHCAAESTGHGSPLATLVHGGPGRAGGSEEMGGMRGLLHYMQRTAIQGSPETLSRIGGRFIRGAMTRAPRAHPFRIPFFALALGDCFESVEREITVADIEAFAALSGDRFYAHMSEAEGARNPLFGGRVAHGYFLISAAAGLFVDPDYGPVLGNYGLDALRFVKPVKPGDRIRVRIACKQKSLRPEKGWGEVRWDTEISNQDGELVASYDVLTMVSIHSIPDQAV